MKRMHYAAIVVGTLLIFGFNDEFSESISEDGVPRSKITRAISDDFSYVSPTDVGIAETYISFLGDEVASWVENREINGAEILLLKGNQVFHHEVIGWRDVALQVPLEPNAIYSIKSMTKAYTGMAILQLVERGELSLTDPVRNYIDGFPSEVTIQHLLSMLSGYGGADPIGSKDVSTLEKAVHHLIPSEERLTLGTFRYTDLNTIFLGYILEQVTGSTVQAYFQECIIDSLNLTDTYVGIPAESPLGNRVMPLYSWDFSHLDVIKTWELGQGAQPGSKPFWDPSGDVMATITDYAKFIRTWMQGGRWMDTRVLSDSLAAAAIRPQGSTAYGFTWRVSADSVNASYSNYFGHGGFMGTHAMAFPEEDIVAIIFTQTAGTFAKKRIEQLFTQPELVGRDYFYPIPVDIPSIAAVDSTSYILPEWQGTYLANQDQGRTGLMATLSERDHFLYLKLGEPAIKSGLEFHLIPYSSGHYLAGTINTEGVFVNEEFVINLSIEEGRKSLTVTHEHVMRFRGFRIEAVRVQEMLQEMRSENEND